MGTFPKVPPLLMNPNIFAFCEYNKGVLLNLSV